MRVVVLDVGAQDSFKVGIEALAADAADPAFSKRC
jgi:hypothetical protein